MTIEATVSDDDFWSHLRRFAGNIPFAKDMVAMYLCSQDEKTPLPVKATIIGAIAYFVLPADAVPDVIVGAGMLDDAAVFTAALAAIGQHLRPEHHQEAKKLLS